MLAQIGFHLFMTARSKWIFQNLPKQPQCACVCLYMCVRVCVCVWDLFKVSEKTRCPRDLLQITESILTAHRRVESPTEWPYRRTCILAPCGCARSPSGRRSRSRTSSGSITSTKTRTQTQSTRKVTTGTVIEPENYIFQAIFTRRLMADVRAASGVVCGQQWNNLLLPSWAAHHLAKIEPSDMSRVNASHNYTLTRRIGLARLSTMWQESWDPGFAHRPGWKKCGTAGIYRGINANCCGQFTYTHSLVNRSGIENGTGR